MIHRQIDKKVEEESTNKHGLLSPLVSCGGPVEILPDDLLIPIPSIILIPDGRTGFSCFADTSSRGLGVKFEADFTVNPPTDSELLINYSHFNISYYYNDEEEKSDEDLSGSLLTVIVSPVRQRPDQTRPGTRARGSGCLLNLWCSVYHWDY